jgi:hypothetical protein
MKDLNNIQIEIKKELGGESLNHLMNYATLAYKKHIDFYFHVSHYSPAFFPMAKVKIKLIFARVNEKIYEDFFILLNDQNQPLNIFDQSEKFQRNLYEAIQIIKNWESNSKRYHEAMKIIKKFRNYDIDNAGNGIYE